MKNNAPRQVGPTLFGRREPLNGLPSLAWTTSCPVCGRTWISLLGAFSYTCPGCRGSATARLVRNKRDETAEEWCARRGKCRAGHILTPDIVYKNAKTGYFSCLECRREVNRHRHRGDHQLPGV